MKRTDPLKRQKMTEEEVVEQLETRRRQENSLPELPLELWEDLLFQTMDDAKWQFMDVMRFIQNDVGPLGIIFAQVLTISNRLWMLWFFDEFPDFVGDLELEYTVHKIPFPWMEKSIAFSIAHPHPDDALFENVPWRSCYMWAHMFRRQCARYMARHVSDVMVREKLGDKVWRHMLGKFGEGFPQFADYMHIREDDGFTQVTVSFNEQGDPLHDDKIEFVDRHHDLDLNHVILEFEQEQDTDSRIISSASPYRAWYVYLYKRWMLSDTDHNASVTVTDTVIRRPDPRYRFNFSSEMIESFVRWYVLRMRATIEAELGPPERRQMTFHALIDINEKRQHISLERRTAELGYYDPKTDSWPYLERLPLCPRRTDLTLKRDVQFLGDLQQQHAK